MTSDASNASTRDLPPLVADHELLRRVGVGAYGEVWLARSVTGILRAVKVVWRCNFDHDRTYEREFAGLRKFEPLSRRHDGLVDILHIGRNDEAGYFFYVMELADDAAGSAPAEVASYVPLTLAELLRQRGRLPVAECARLGAAVAEALAFLHREQLIHRDLKPSNLIFVGGHPKLADIGLVVGVGEARSFVGTEGYIPPEGPGSVQADLFSLGRVLYEMATGKSRHEFPDLPGGLLNSPDAAAFAELNEIILRAAEPDAAKRHRSADELRGELLLVDAGRSVRRLRRNERLIARWQRFGAVTLLAGLTALGAVWFERRQAAAANQRAAAEAAQRRLVEDKERVARQNLYAADMNLAQQAITAGNYGRAEELLGAWRPGPGEPELRGFEWFHYWHRVRGDSIGVLRGHEEVVSSLVLSLDGQRLFSAGFDSTVREWSLAEQREIRRWHLPGGLVMAMALDRAGERMVVECGNRPLTGLLHLKTGRWTTNVLSASPSITFTPEGDRLVRGANMRLFETNGVVEITDMEFRVERVLEQAGGRAWFSPDGKLLVTGSWGHDLRLWTWPELAEAGRLTNAGAVISVSFSPGGKRLVSGARDGRLILWDLAQRVPLRQVVAHNESIVWSVAFAPDGRRLATGGNDQAVRVWTADTLAELDVFRGHGSEVWVVQWTPDGQRLISAGKDSTIRIWNASPKAPPLELTGVTQPPVFSPDGKRIAVRRRNAGVSVWDVAASRLLWEVAGLELGGFSPEGERLTLLRDDRTWECRRAKDGELLETRSVQPPSAEYSRRRLSASGRWVATGDNQGGITLQDLKSKSSPRLLQGHVQMVTLLEFTADERQLVSGSMDRSARVWDLETGTGKAALTGHRMAVASGEFFPDGTRLLTGSWDDTARLWDLTTGRELGVFGGHPAAVHDVALAPDGRTFAALSGAGVLKFWNLAARREAGVISLERGTGLGWLRFSPDGGWLAAVSQSGRLTLLPAASAER